MLLVTNPILWLLGQIVGLYSIVIIVYLVTRILIQFGVLNGYNPVVRFVLDFGQAAVEPALRPIQRYVPPISNIDLSPIILLLGLRFGIVLITWLFVQLGIA